MPTLEEAVVAPESGSCRPGGRPGSRSWIPASAQLWAFGKQAWGQIIIHLLTCSFVLSLLNKTHMGWLCSVWNQWQLSNFWSFPDISISNCFPPWLGQSHGNPVEGVSVCDFRHPLSWTAGNLAWSILFQPFTYTSRVFAHKMHFYGIISLGFVFQHFEPVWTF